jgi:hypothetical protein
MPSEEQKIVFARINRRRADGQETLMARSFREDMAALAASHQTRYVQHVGRGLDRTWFAADMSIQPDEDFLTGALGYTTPAQHRPFDQKNWSWIKAQPADIDAANTDTIAPFAIDLREGYRWVAFAPKSRLRVKMFATGFERVLNNAISAEGLIPTEWEVDLIVSRGHIDEWLREHPLVYLLKRTIKFTNPGRDLSSDRQEMQALGARRKTEEFAASNRGLININSEEFSSKLEGIETGDIELKLRSRRDPGTGSAIFDSNTHPDAVSVDSFGGDLVQGMSIVLTALRQYVAEKLRL